MWAYGSVRRRGTLQTGRRGHLRIGYGDACNLNLEMVVSTLSLGSVQTDSLGT